MTGQRYPASMGLPAPRARFEAAGQHDTLLAALRAVGLQLPMRANSSAHTGVDVRVDWLGPRRFVVTTSLADEEQLYTTLQRVFAGFELADVCCTTDMVVTFELAGPGAADVLAQGTALDVSDAAFAAGSATVTDLWGVAAVVERPTDLPGCRRVTVDRSLAGFVEGWLQTANGLRSALKPGVMRTAHGAETLAKSASRV